MPNSAPSRLQRLGWSAMADFKVRLEVSHTEIFYYPDVVVSCHPTGIERHFLRLPTLIVEVQSPRRRPSIAVRSG